MWSTEEVNQIQLQKKTNEVQIEKYFKWFLMDSFFLLIKRSAIKAEDIDTGVYMHMHERKREAEP